MFSFVFLTEKSMIQKHVFLVKQFLKKYFFHVSCKTENQLTSFLGIIPNKEIFNNSSSLQNSLHNGRRDIREKGKEKRFGKRTKKCEREAQPKREASRAKPAEENKMARGFLVASPQEPLAGLILKHTQNGRICAPKI